MQKFIYNSELKLYRSLINAFFTLGGKAWLRRKYKNNIAERMGDIKDFNNAIKLKDSALINVLNKMNSLKKENEELKKKIYQNENNFNCSHNNNSNYQN